MALKLNPEPTFKSEVRIPVPGGDAEPVSFTFKHRTRSQIKAFPAEVKGKPDVEVVKMCVMGWGLDDEFNDDNVMRLIENYPGASKAIVDTYFDELGKTRSGN